MLKRTLVVIAIMSFALVLTSNTFGQSNRSTNKRATKNSKVKTTAGFQTSSEDLREFKSSRKSKKNNSVKGSAGFQTSSDDLRQRKSGRKIKTGKAKVQ